VGSRRYEVLDPGISLLGKSHSGAHSVEYEDRQALVENPVVTEYLRFALDLGAWMFPYFQMMVTSYLVLRWPLRTHCNQTPYHALSFLECHRLRVAHCIGMIRTMFLRD